MKFYSEITKQFYDSYEECQQHEELLLKQQQEEEKEKLRIEKELDEICEQLKQKHQEYLTAQEEYRALVKTFYKLKNELLGNKCIIFAQVKDNEENKIRIERR